MKKWSDMANLSHEMRNKIEKLERNFNVSAVIFRKFEPIFSNIFKCPITSPSKQPKNRKQRYYIYNVFLNIQIQNFNLIDLILASLVILFHLSITSNQNC